MNKLLNRVAFAIIFFIALFFCAQLLLRQNFAVASTVQNHYQLWEEPDAGRTPLYEAIAHAKTEIDLVMYLFTDKNMANALAKAANRGVKVRALIEKSPYDAENTNAWLTQAWQNSKIQWHWVPASASSLHFYHEKSLLIDHKQLFVMTMNFVHSSFSRKNPERNFILEDENSDDVKEAQMIFDQDFTNQLISLLPHNTHLVVSPINAREQLLHVIQHSQKTLDIYAEGLTDYTLLRAIENAADRGVKVRILYGDDLHKKIKIYLRKHHVIFQHPQLFHNHAKVIIADDQNFYLGSINFTRNSIEANRELGVVLNQSNLAHELTQFFERDWSQG